MNSLTESFVYAFDSTGRLNQTDKNSSTVATYSFDNNSNRNGGTIGAQSTNATYDDQDRMLTYNTLSFTYNANGDLTSKTNNTTSQTTTYSYDVFGNLRQVNVPPSTAITYEIDGLNRRIAKKVNGTVQKRWVYMDRYRIAAELNSSGAITKRFVWGSKANVPDYLIASGVKYRIISDHLGSPRLVVKQSDGTVIQRMNHDEFGRVTEDTNPGYLPFGFAGGHYDNQTGLVRFGMRDFDPETGRWTSKDPILFGGGDTNLYGYVANDPVNWVDPTGLARGDWWDLPANYSYAHQTGIQLRNQMPGWNDAGDAARHAEWNRLMVQNTNLFTAWTTGVGHEITGLISGQSLSEALMDLHNNSIGRNAGSSGSAVNPLELVISPGARSKYNPYGSCGGQ